jgi:diguanylate cyclase (GGDEF)-like protein
MNVVVSGYFLLNLFCIFVLIIILEKKVWPGGISFSQKLFDAMAIITIILLFTDACIWILEGKKGALFKNLNILSTVIYYIAHPLILSFWTLYADFSIFRNWRKTKTIGIGLIAVNAVFIFFIIASIWKGYIFYINEENYYTRGNYFIYFFAACYAFIAYTFFMILFNRKKAEPGIFKTLLFFAVPPIAAGVIQANVYGVTLLWPSMTISILLIYINIQNSLLTTDYLTGIYNRRQFDLILNRRISFGGSKFSLIMIDIDDFKTINDRFGHNEGDIALESAVKIIQHALRTGDIIARYAGDEFLVMLEMEDSLVLNDAIERIRKKSTEWNSTSGKQYNLSFSMGSGIFSKDDNLSIEGIIKSVDELMYLDKKNKNLRNR